MNIENMTAIELLDIMTQQIAESGSVGFQFEEGGPVIVCTIADYEDLVSSDIELTSTKPLH